jgi:hypothetical protein
MQMVWRRAVAFLAVATAVGVIRFFLLGWIGPLGVPTVVGSLIASLTVVLLVAIVALFGGEGRTVGGVYWRAAGAYVALALWCEILTIGGILLSARLGIVTYYSGPWEMVHRAFASANEHALAHSVGFFIRLTVALLLGRLAYWIGARGRRTRG